MQRAAGRCIGTAPCTALRPLRYPWLACQQENATVCARISWSSLKTPQISKPLKFACLQLCNVTANASDILHVAMHWQAATGLERAIRSMDRVQCALNQALREKSDEGLLELYENASVTLNDGHGLPTLPPPYHISDSILGSAFFVAQPARHRRTGQAL
jgi:hypothetical protein